MAAGASSPRAFDPLLQELADYVCSTEITSDLAFQTARWCLMDSLGCAILALDYPACTKLLGPLVPGLSFDNGTPIPGTSWRLDPLSAAFNLGTMVRWLDFNDTWLAAEWGHPSDNLGAVLAVADYRARVLHQPTDMRLVLEAMIKAHEVQGVLALQNSFNRVGLDHVLLVRVASTAVATWLLGGTREEVLNALSHAFIDGGALRTYRHAPNTGSRKSWAAGDATSRAVRLAMIAKTGEMGYATALTAPKWGFCDVLFNGQPLQLERPLGSYVMENVLFKISFPAEFHAQTAVEAALQLHSQVASRLEEVERVDVETQEAGVRIIDKSGPLHNPADRDHCLQYMIAIGLIFGELNADHYEDSTAADPRIDQLRGKMEVKENKQFSLDYLDPEKRSIPNAIQVHFTDGTRSERIQVDFPIGHRRRREEGVPVLIEKMKQNLQRRFAADQVSQWATAWANPDQLDSTSITDFLEQLVGS